MRASSPLPRARQLSTGRTAGEPTLGVSSNGTLFYVGLTGAGGPGLLPHSIVQRSRDGGASWKQLDPLIKGVSNDTVTADPYLYIDPRTDRLFNVDFVGPCSVISRSDDEGEHFKTSLVCNHADHQSLFAGPPPANGARPQGYPNLVYYCALDGGVTVVSTFTACSRSLDGGRTWHRTRNAPYRNDGTGSGGALGLEGACTGTVSHGRVDRHGVIYLPRGFCDQPYLAISRDEGERWTRTKVSNLGVATGTSAGLGLQQHESRVAIDRNGVVYYLWMALDRLPYLAISRDGGRSFGRPLMVAAPGVNESWNPSIEVGDPGRIAISYMGTTNSPGPPYCVSTTPTSCRTAIGKPPKPASAYAKTGWNGYMSVSVNALAPKPQFLTTTVNDPADPLTRGECGVVQCQQQVDFLSLALSRGGKPFASFVDGCPRDPAQDCETIGTGIVGTLAGGPPLVGSLGRSGGRAELLSGLRLSRKRFRAARRGRAVARRRQRLGRRVGTRVRYRLRAGARVTFLVQRARRRNGSLVGGRCVRRTQRNRSHRRCVRFRTLRGRVVVRGHAGTNRFRFTGRIRGRRLRPGRYRLIARARAPRGERSGQVRRRFRIVRR